MNPRIIGILNREKPPRSSPLSNFEKICHELRPCDVLLVEGRSRVSEMIRRMTNSPWTHAALYIGRVHDIEDDDIRTIIQDRYQGDASDRLVIESLLGRGTIIRNVNVYEQDHLRICRPDRLSHADGVQVVRYAMHRLGADYDVRQIFDLLRFLFPFYLLPRRLASTLFAPKSRRRGKLVSNSRMKTVCSTMIAEAFGYVQYPILPLVKQDDSGDDIQLFRRNPRLCVPSDFDFSPYFQIIKYPFLDFFHEEYHLLPWNDTDMAARGMLTGEEADLYFRPHGPDKEEVENTIAEAASTAYEGKKLEEKSDDSADAESGDAENIDEKSNDENPDAPSQDNSEEQENEEQDQDRKQERNQD